MNLRVSDGEKRRSSMWDRMKKIYLRRGNRKLCGFVFFGNSLCGKYNGIGNGSNDESQSD